jgi:hypothetical protein
MKNKLNAIFITILLTVCFTQLKAQTTSTTSPAMSADQISAAKRVIAASAVTENLKKTLSSVIQTQAAQVPADKKDKFIAIMNQFFDKYFTADAVTQGLIPIYASEYSADELNKIADFLETPAGKAMTAKQPEILTQSMALGQKIASDHQAELENSLKTAFGQ